MHTREMQPGEKAVAFSGVVQFWDTGVVGRSRLDPVGGSAYGIPLNA
jgi:hypothetical protein